MSRDSDRAEQMFNETARRIRNGWRIMGCLWLIGLVLVGLVVWVAWHFIAKFW